MKDYVYANIKNNKTLKVSKKTTLYELSKSYQDQCKYPILIAKVNNELCELRRSLVVDSTVEFLDITDINGFRTYQRSVVFLMLCAVKELLDIKTRVVIEHSINKNYYVEIIDDNANITDDLIKEIESRMHTIAEKNYPIKKYSLNLTRCIEFCERFGMEDKLKILKFRRTRNVNFYSLSWFYNYFYGYLVHDTSVLTDFKLSKQSNGFILQFPDVDNPKEMTELKPFKKISKVFIESSHWARILNIETVGALNEKICNGQLGDIIRMSEALHEKKIATIADMIYNKKCSLVLIAGPSSSGKTTFSNRLGVQLRVNGLKTHIISIDDYFKNQDKTPGETKDDFDFESIDAIDTEQLNSDLTRLLNGDTVNIPSFNFATGKRENKNNFLKLEKNDILVVEGIHGLNKKIAPQLNDRLKFKIFVSALTQINVDDHNRIPTSDTRIFRRIVRDYQFRKLDAVSTIKMWPSVVKGESKYIFPYQEEADAIFNSALVYELSVIKQFVEPILFAIDNAKPEYLEARRLIKFLDCFFGVNSEEVPSNSIIREFIGGSCFF